MIAWLVKLAFLRKGCEGNYTFWSIDVRGLNLAVGAAVKLDALETFMTASAHLLQRNIMLSNDIFHSLKHLKEHELFRTQVCLNPPLPFQMLSSKSKLSKL